MKRKVLTLVVFLFLALPIFATLPPNFNPEELEDKTWEQIICNYTVITEGVNATIIEQNGEYYIIENPNYLQEITWDAISGNYIIIYEGSNGAYTIVKINGVYYIVFE